MLKQRDQIIMYDSSKHFILQLNPSKENSNNNSNYRIEKCLRKEEPYL